ncbi:MAG: hypothetical protein JSW49_09765 [candidate division WOR-3 bacterium]|nr:MAG: hypothetical protein JSW49_09765 [candidate division WOR-3 bacterium]
MSNRVTRAIQLITGLLVISVFTAQAQDLRVAGANYGEYWVFFQNEEEDTNYREHLEDKFKLSLAYGDITLRGVFFFSDPSLPEPQKLSYFDYSAQYSKDPVSIIFGRFNKTFGRGLVLNQFMDEDFKIDKSLYGIQAGIEYFNTELTVLSGEPRNVFFEENVYTIKNDNDTTAQIRGIDLETKVIPKLNLGGRYVRINQESNMTPEAFTELFGGSIGFRTGPFDAYLEYARQMGTKPGLGGRLKGYGILFSSSLALPGLGISFQMMDYDTIGFPYNRTYRYNEPVTPIESGISVNRGVNEIGFGASVIYSPFDFLTIEAMNNKISVHDTTAGKLEQIFTTNGTMPAVTEQALQFLTRPTYDMEIAVGVDRLVKDSIELPVIEKSEIKPYIEFTYNFGTFFIETSYEHDFVTATDTVGPFEYYDHVIAFSIGKPELFVLTLRYERRSEQAPDRLADKLSSETNWPLAELSLDLTNRHNLRIRAGAEKGGLVCSGGVCRFEEPFKGVKFVLTSIF